MVAASSAWSKSVGLLRVQDIRQSALEMVPGMRVQDGFGGLTMDCKWMQDEICVNADCPMCCDFCPVADVPGVCRFEERGGING